MYGYRIRGRWTGYLRLEPLQRGCCADETADIVFVDKRLVKVASLF
ncbi:hypothetical protein HMPREF1585_00337 [Gardnerella vaginalis JCP8481B]|nr:hypothetical protein HMPREF1585_00337 [Gardnerella vaginalis JCP8481B]